MSSDVSDSLRRLVAERAYRVCEYCLIHEADTFFGCQVDHIISRKHGGGSEAGNLAWACAPCNAAKGSDIATLVGEPLRLSALYHPRKDPWRQHFHLAHVVVEMLTDIGAATGKLLQINHPSRIEERTVLAEIGRYPTVEALARIKD